MTGSACVETPPSDGFWDPERHIALPVGDERQPAWPCAGQPNWVTNISLGANGEDDSIGVIEETRLALEHGVSRACPQPE